MSLGPALSRAARLALAAVLLAPRAALALDPVRELGHYGLDSWQAENGLPQSSIAAVVQTRDGYLWLATQEGLVRFDGVRFTVFDTGNASAFRNNHVTALLETSAGELWIGTLGGGVVVLKDRAFRAQGLVGDRVNALAEDALGNLWIGGPNGLVRLRGDRATLFGPAQGLPAPVIKCLLADPDGILWVGTSAGLARIRGEAAEPVATAEGPGAVDISALARGANGALWVGTAGGLYQLIDGRFQAPPAAGLPREPVRALLVDRSGSLWVGTAAGLSRCRDGRCATLGRRDGLPADLVQSLQEDREGNLWIGTQGGGLARLKDGTVSTRTVRDGLSADNVYAVTGGQRGGLWVGGIGGGVDHFDGRRFSRLALPEAASSSQVRALLEDRAGRLWIATDRGLLRRTARGFAWLDAKQGLPQSIVRAIAEDSEGRVWLGTDGAGLAVLDGDRVRSFGPRDGLPGNEVRAILPSRGGDVWVGTYGGLGRYHQGRFTAVTQADGLPHALVRSLLEDEDGTLWVGTYGGGLVRYRDGRFVSFTRRQGLLCDVVYQILDDARGGLWMSCNRGIFRVARSELDAVVAGRAKSVRVQAFDESDGMRSRECNGGNPAGWRAADGGLWFPTIRGLVRVDPGRAGSLSPAPPVVVEDLTVDGEPVGISPGLRLAPHPGRLVFGFTAPGLVAPQKVRFAYRLDGLDREWVEAGGARTATFTHVPPGAYVFRVIARQGEGDWGQPGAALALSVDPAIYETRPFRALLAAALLAGVVGVFRLRTRQLRRHEHELEARVEEAMARIKVLKGLLPICAHCKKVRDDQGYWSQIEVFIREHSEADFSHSLCHDCLRELYPEVAEGVIDQAGPKG
jgi:ligand-binding sensor domain-containing protein